MKSFKQKLIVSIFPFLVIIWGIFMLTFFDPFYSKSSDPEFPYLVNGLNCATLKFNYIGHIDHPGTPFQVYNGIIIRITHFVSGKGNIARDVFARPEHYLNAISNSLILLQSALMFGIGLLGFKRKIPFWQVAFLQASLFFNELLMWLFCRVNPDRFFEIVVYIFILIYLKHGYENRSPRKFALWSGTAMALGLATKFNFLPVLILPLLLIDTNKNRLIYIGSGMVSFFIFIAPIITKFDEYFRFLTSIFKHDGLYGGGESKVLNFQKMTDSTFEIFRLNPELLVLIIVLIVLIVIAIRKKNKGIRKFSFLFAGYLFIIALQILMVSKHFKNYYLAPTFIIYGFMFFTISNFLSGVMKKQNHLILVSNILPLLFILATVTKVINDYPLISQQIDHRNKISAFVDTKITKADYWFIEPTWESGPNVENAIVYGLSYCGHRDDYLPQLMSVNPNVITYEDNTEQVKLWRGESVSLDSIVATGKNIHIYSTPGRHASILVQMVKDAASRNNLELSIDTVFSDRETQNEIIKIKAMNSNSRWTPNSILTNTRQQKIEEYVRSIKSTPEWLEKVKQKAVQKNIPLDSMILLDAIYMTDSEK
ncbi:MAG: hypothetical protein PHP53_22485 [Prolixibacteraceae bacterium]|nr:hypothetical protein [Prolixibacteraceae bacterium]